MIEDQRKERTYRIFAVVDYVGLLDRLGVDFAIQKDQALLRERSWVGEYRFREGNCWEYWHWIGGDWRRFAWGRQLGLFKLHLYDVKTNKWFQSQLKSHLPGLNLNTTCLSLPSNLFGEVKWYFLSWFESGETFVWASCATECVTKIAITATRLHDSLIDFLNYFLLRFLSAINQRITLPPYDHSYNWHMLLV